MKYSSIFLIIAFLFCSCNTDYSLRDLQKEIIEITSDDGQISQIEYSQLTNNIQSSSDKRIQRFKMGNDSIDHQALKGYILKYANSKGIDLDDTKTWNPNSPEIENLGFNINVFMENSGSMNGYVKDPSTQFKNSIYSLLTRLKLFAGENSLNLYFINKQNQLQFADASNNDIESFKDILNPNDFRKISMGMTGDTDINELIKRTMESVDGNNMAVFISDCIYSPGKQNKNALDYLAEQKHGLFLNISTELKERESDFSILILQLKAGFEGLYYFPDNSNYNFTSTIDRPYYIWFIGTNHQIEEILKSKKLEEIDGDYLNKWIVRKPENKQLKYKILYSPKIGSFSAKGLPQGKIIKAKSSTQNQNKGDFSFSVAVDFTGYLQDESYLMNPSNYRATPDYQLSINPISDPNNPALEGFTHIIKLNTKNLRTQDIKVELLEKTPGWIIESSSVDDSSIDTDANEQSKTFGLQYLMEGVSEAFYPLSEENIICSFKINIEKN